MVDFTAVSFAPEHLAQHYTFIRRSVRIFLTLSAKQQQQQTQLSDSLIAWLTV